MVFTLVDMELRPFPAPFPVKPCLIPSVCLRGRRPLHLWPVAPPLSSPASIPLLRGWASMRLLVVPGGRIRQVCWSVTKVGSFSRFLPLLNCSGRPKSVLAVLLLRFRLWWIRCASCCLLCVELMVIMGMQWPSKVAWIRKRGCYISCKTLWEKYFHQMITTCWWF